MAKCDIVLPTDFMKALESLENSDEVVQNILTSVEPTVAESLKSEVSPYRETGSMFASIKSKIYKRGDGWALFVRPTGKDGKGTRNMEKLMYLEFGTKSQPARAVVTKAVSKVRDKVLMKAQEVFDDYVKK